MSQLDQMKRALIMRLSWNLERGNSRIPIVSKKSRQHGGRKHTSRPLFALFRPPALDVQQFLLPSNLCLPLLTTTSKHSILHQKGEIADAFPRPLHAIALYSRRATAKPNPTFPPLTFPQILSNPSNTAICRRGRERAKKGEMGAERAESPSKRGRMRSKQCIN